MIQRLNLTPPQGETGVEKPTAAPIQLPEPNPEAVKEVLRRTQEILNSNVRPEQVFLCGVENGLLTIAPEGKPIVLLFSNPLFVEDYIRATKVRGMVRVLKCSALPATARSWEAAGVADFVLDRCPRCNIMLQGALKALVTEEDFRKIWAGVRASKLYQGGVQAQIAMKSLQNMQSTSAARAALENIRDHIDCSNPYVFMMLAYVTGMQNDTAAKMEAIERLKPFGPQFAWQEGVAAEQMAKAFVGLLGSFNLLKKPEAGPSGAKPES